MTDIDLDAPVAMTRREALREARAKLSAVVNFAIKPGLTPDKFDCENISEAFRLINLALDQDA